jgi:hypothetical protein
MSFITTAAYAAMTPEEKIAYLEQENEAERAKNTRSQTLRLKVSEKGGLSLYGLGRFPVTLYKSQWLKLLEFAAVIVQFIQDHDSELTEKR